MVRNVPGDAVVKSKRAAVKGSNVSMYRNNREDLKSYGKYNIVNVSDGIELIIRTPGNIISSKKKNNKRSEGIVLYINHA